MTGCPRRQSNNNQQKRHHDLGSRESENGGPDRVLRDSGERWSCRETLAALCAAPPVSIGILLCRNHGGIIAAAVSSAAIGSGLFLFLAT